MFVTKKNKDAKRFVKKVEDSLDKLLENDAKVREVWIFFLTFLRILSKPGFTLTKLKNSVGSYNTYVTPQLVSYIHGLFCTGVSVSVSTAAITRDEGIVVDPFPTYFKANYRLVTPR